MIAKTILYIARIIIGLFALAFAIVAAGVLATMVIKGLSFFL